MTTTPTESWEQKYTTSAMLVEQVRKGELVIPLNTAIFLTKLLLDTQIDLAFKAGEDKGREEAVGYILANWDMLEGETSNAVRKSVASHAGEVTGIKSSDASDGRTS